MQSYFVYIGTVLLAWGLAWAEEHTVERDKRIFVFLVIALLTFICGCRGLSVGRDTWGYAYNYEHQVLDWYEAGFTFIQKVLYLINPNATFFFLVMAFFTNYYFIKRFYDFKDRGAGFSWCVLFFAAISFTVGFNGIRQWLAVAICFYATRYIYNDESIKLFKYLFYTIIAISIHFSAIIMFVFLFPLLFGKKRSLKIQALRFLSLLIVLIAAFAVNEMMGQRSYERYLEVGEFHFGMMSIVKAIIILLTILNYRNETYDGDEGLITNHGEIKITYKGMIAIECIFVALSSLSYWFNAFSRIAWYLEPFETLYFAHIFTQKKHTDVIQIIKILILIVMVTKFTGNFSVIEMKFPYLFFWQ